MLPSLMPIAHWFAVGDTMLDRLVGDWSPTDWRYRDPAGHDARWIVGHVAIHRRRVAALVGNPCTAVDWESAFQRGSSSADVPDHVDPYAVHAACHDAHAHMVLGWPTLTEEALLQSVGRVLPDGSRSVGGAIRFLAWHEAYHLGQLGLLRRMIGKPGIA
jgi:hypothetical protein